MTNSSVFKIVRNRGPVIGLPLICVFGLGVSGNAAATEVEAAETGGYTITSPEGNFSFSFGNRIQLRYSFFDRDEAQDTSEMRVRRLRPAFTGHVYTRDLTYTIVPDVADDWDLLVGVLNYRYTDQFQVRFGQGKTPYGFERYASSGRQSFVDRSISTGFFDHGFPVGLMAHGQLIPALSSTYEVGVFTPAGRDQRNEDNRHQVVGRIDIQPMGTMQPRRVAFPSAPIPDMRWRAGVAASYNKMNVAQFAPGNRITGVMGTASGALAAQDGVTGPEDPATEIDDVSLQAYNLDFGWQLGGTTFFAEGHWLEANPSGGDASRARANGYYAAIGQFLGNEWQVVARYSEVNPDRDVSGTNLQETRVGLNWFQDGHGYKVQADLGQVEDKATSIRDNDFRVQWQLTF